METKKHRIQAKKLASLRAVALTNPVSFAWSMIRPIGFTKTINLEGGSVAEFSRKSTVMVCLVILLCSFLVCPLSLFALPTDWKVEAGDAKVEAPDANTLNFTVADKTVINFGSFNIGQNEAVNLSLIHISEPTRPY